MFAYLIFKADILSVKEFQTKQIDSLKAKMYLVVALIFADVFDLYRDFKGKMPRKILITIRVCESDGAEVSVSLVNLSFNRQQRRNSAFNTFYPKYAGEASLLLKLQKIANLDVQSCYLFYRFV